MLFQNYSIIKCPTYFQSRHIINVYELNIITLIFVHDHMFPGADPGLFGWESNKGEAIMRGTKSREGVGRKMEIR